MNPLDQLHDIEGLDWISPWPLALGWWVLMGIVLIVLSAVVLMVLRRLSFKRSWKFDALQSLDTLEKNLTSANTRDSLIALSEYIRRIAVKRFPRKECAGLTGNAWLTWLSDNDPKKFDWKNLGLSLIEIPYAPLHVSPPVSEVKDMILAVKGWVR